MKKPRFFIPSKQNLRLYRKTKVRLYNKTGIAIKIVPNHVAYMKNSKSLVTLKHTDGSVIVYYSEILTQ